MSKQPEVTFSNDDANDIANDVAGMLIKCVHERGGAAPGVMTTLNMVQALVVKNCLHMVGDSMNMARADTMLDMSSEQSKKIIRMFSERPAN